MEQGPESGRGMHDIEHSDFYWAPVQRGRSYTAESLSDSSGKKRKQEPAAGATPQTGSQDEKEPTNKRVKPVSKVAVTTNPVPPSKVTPLRRLSQTIQRTISLRSDNQLFSFSPRSRSRNPSAASKRRNSKLWSETFDHVSEELSAKEVKRQEVIFELMQGEQQLVDDLNLVKKNYYEPMLKLSIMSSEELSEIFSTLESFIPLHEDLLRRLLAMRQADGTVHEVGPTLLNWLPGLHAYERYCCNQVAAKALLDYKKQNRQVENFLRLCQESAFSRRLDLWNFLDLPRSRLVKYPLLLKEILKQTGTDHPDWAHLQEVIALSQDIVGLINSRTGEAECQYYKKRLLYLYDSQQDATIPCSRILLCHGELKNSKGQRLHVFLFEAVLVITRPLSREEQLCYQVYRQPIPVQDLVLEDLPDGEVRLGGSIRGAFITGNERAKNFFRVSFCERSRGQSHTLQANDAFNKQQWLSCLRRAMMASRGEDSTGSLTELAGLSIHCTDSTMEEG
ncbi:rho guanine nucleotide exchange factor 3 isoform X1 [Microcaecilia unicolor]|uniref:Rho guanine nucleotide exchange factor 3 n=1 Tax=Microcaecilia unicolor TaxID=1415580 RepID=A0A6P7X956_9AMPH|nr:rho guanine nucleotide exchange factor 3-like isoform X1 [Microcaecilia unicolor]